MGDSPRQRSGGEPPEPEAPPTPSNAALGRRKFLVRATAAGTAAWAVPAIITMEPAGAAALTSPPPEIEVLPKTLLDPPGDPIIPPGDPIIEVAAAKTPAAKPQVEVLASTGAPIDTLLGAGASALVGGSALHVWSARAARHGATAPDIPAAPASPEIPETPAV